MMDYKSIFIVCFIILAITIGGFFLLREIILWYFRINRIVANQEITNDLLRKLLEHQTGEIYEIDRDLMFKAEKFSAQAAEDEYEN